MMDVYRGDVKICTADKATNTFTMARGLMFKKSLGKEEGLLIKGGEGRLSGAIHSWFMRFSIDLIFIDADMKVFDLTTLKPWGAYFPKGRPAWVLEINEGVITSSWIGIGDKLEFR